MATSSVRFTLGEENDIKDVEKITTVLEEIVEKLRKNKRVEKIKCKCQ